MNISRKWDHEADRERQRKNIERKRKEDEAKRKLIAEAVSVHNDTGYSPRQLADQKKALLDACKWINKFISTACDGGDAWCAVREQPGASEWAEDMKAAIAGATNPVREKEVE